MKSNIFIKSMILHITLNIIIFAAIIALFWFFWAPTVNPTCTHFSFTKAWPCSYLPSGCSCLHAYPSTRFFVMKYFWSPDSLQHPPLKRTLWPSTNRTDVKVEREWGKLPRDQHLKITFQHVTCNSRRPLADQICGVPVEQFTIIFSSKRLLLGHAPSGPNGFPEMLFTV